MVRTNERRQNIGEQQLLLLLREHIAFRQRQAQHNDYILAEQILRSAKYLANLRYNAPWRG